jgi:hypothetical protein
MTATIEKMNSRHYKMLYSYVTEGLSNRDMANRFDMNEGYIPTIKNSPAWKKEEEALRNEIYGSHKAKLGNLVPDAIETLSQVMNNRILTEKGENGDPNLYAASINPPASRTQAASKILEIAGYGDKTGGGAGAKSVVIQMYRPPWAEGEGDAVSVEVNL